MKTLILCQEAVLNVGVIGVLHAGKETFVTLETKNCLKPGEYSGEFVNGKLVLENDYKVLMDRHGKLRNDGLLIGTEFLFNVFDVKDKGVVIEKLYKHCEGEKVKVIVQRITKDASEDLKTSVEALEKRTEEKLAELDAEIARYKEGEKRMKVATAKLQETAAGLQKSVLAGEATSTSAKVKGDGRK